MSTITREFTKGRLLALSNRENVGAICSEEIVELARIALASLEAEAVGFIARHKETGKFGSYLHPKADWFKSDEYEVLSAYTAPPAPVVPLAIHDEDFEKALSVLNDTLDDCGDSERGLLLALDKVGIEVRSDARHAAMLQAVGGNSPAIPDGWVLVPKEPTPAMLNAAWVSHGIYHASAYRTMLAAAPQQNE